MMTTNRINNVKPSAAVDLDRKIAQMRQNGEEILSLNAGQPDFNTPDNIVSACYKALTEGKTRYTQINGILELRKAVCEKLKKENGINYNPEEIFITAGAKQALYNVMQVLVNPEDEVIIPTPCWVSYTQMVKLAGGNPVSVKTKNNFHLDLQAIENAVTLKTKAIIINTPNNPTGAVYTKEELNALAEIAVRNNLHIISDEVYEKLIYDGVSHFSIASISDEVKKHCITVNSFSKSYAMTGWRVGYLAATEEITSAVSTLQSHSTSNCTSFVQWAAIEALRGPQNSVMEMVSEFNKRRNYIFGRVSAICGIKCEKPQGAFYIFPDVSYFFGKKDPSGTVIENSEDLCRYILKESGVAVLPGTDFDCPSSIRIAYASSMENIHICMDKIEKCLDRLH